MLISVSNPRAPHPSAAVTTLAVWLARLAHGFRSARSSAGTFERVDGAALQAGDFRASDSLGLDGAPAMAFTDTMPNYSHLIDRPFVPDAGASAATAPCARSTEA